MGRYTGPSCRLCRREGVKLYLKGSRCYTPKCPLEKGKSKKPGMQGERMSKISDYGIRLREKQKLRSIYGIREEQFQRLFDKVSKERGVTGEIFLILLERRLDNVVYKMGMASSMKEARQMVNHGFFLVNERRVDIPSYLVKEGDVIEVKENKKGKMEKILERVPEKETPAWIEVNKESMKCKILRFPSREEISLPVEEQMVVELYSR